MKKELVRWYQKYEVGHPQIDAEHCTLLEKINVLWTILEECAGMPVLIDALDQIVRYTEFHFHSEEQLMAQHSYPDREKHERIHQHLLGQLTGRIEELHSSPPDNTIEAIKLYSFLVDWFVHHSTQEDKKLAEYLQHSPQ